MNSTRRQGARTRPQAGSPEFVAAIARGFDVLRAFTGDETMLGNQELALRTGQPKATVSRLTYTLTRLGYLTYLPQFAKYQLGVGILALGQAVPSAAVWRAARPMMHELALETGASVALGEQDGLDLVYVGRCLPDSPVALRLDAGSRLPLATSAAGRAIFAALPEAARMTILDAVEPGLRAGLHDAVAMHAANGFTVSLGDWKAEVHAVGAPLVLANGAGILGLNCGGPAFAMDRTQAMQEAGPKLLALSRKLAGLLQPA